VSFVPGLGIVKGMGLTLHRFFEPKATVKYPEQKADVAVKFRGRLQLLLDENGALKCETCFQCAQACPIECIDMGGLDTKGRFHVHWGPPETYGERREESAIRRAGRTVPDPAFASFEGLDLSALDEVLERFDHDPRQMLGILEATQELYGHLPVAAIKQISQVTGAWYAMIYGTATYYGHLHFESPRAEAQVAAMAARRPSEAAYLESLGASLAGGAAAAGSPPT
jgi:ferredoxin